MATGMFAGYHAPNNNGLLYAQMFAKLLGGLGQAVGNYQQNQQANQIMNTNNPPRAALVAGPGGESVSAFEQQNPGVSVTGSAPFTGGVKGMQMQMALNKANQAQQNAQLENYYKMAQLGMGQQRLGLEQQRTNYMTQKPYQQEKPIPEYVNNGMATIAGVNQRIQNATGTDLETFMKTKDWTQDGNGNMVSNSLAAKTGKPVVIPMTAFEPLQHDAAGAYGQYKILNQQGYGDQITQMIGGAGAAINSQAQPQVRRATPVAGQTTNFLNPNQKPGQVVFNPAVTQPTQAQAPSQASQFIQNSLTGGGSLQPQGQ